jgi:nucleotide-binding universal stress UspA family protein
MTGFAVIVVGIDGSEVANSALEFAAHEASRRGSRLVIAHAGDIPSWGEREGEVRPFADILGEEAIATVAALHPHVACEFVLRDADAADLLVSLSRGADLLVVGTHRMGRLRGFVLGSVSQRVAAHAMCPVVTVSGPAGVGTDPIVLGASASPGGLAALRFACEEGRLRGVPVRAIRSAITEDWAIAGPGYSVAVSPDLLHDAARAELNAVLTAARDAYPDVAISGEVSDRDPFSALVQAAQRASLVVIGSRRRQDSVLPHLGPVAAWLLHQAQRPLAVVGYSDKDAIAAAAGAPVDNAAVPA